MGLKELERIRLVLRGGSVIEWRRLHFTTWDEVDRFLRLAQIDPTDAGHAAAADSAEIARLETLLAQQERVLARQTELVQKNFISRNALDEATAQRDEYFGNGRWLHNLIEQGIIKCMAQRIMSQPSIPDNTFLFRTITQEDVVKAGNRLRGKQVVKLEPQPIRRIGFRA